MDSSAAVSAAVSSATLGDVYDALYMGNSLQVVMIGVIVAALIFVLLAVRFK